MPRTKRPEPPLNPEPLASAPAAAPPDGAAILERLRPRLQNLARIDPITLDLGDAGLQGARLHKLVTQAPVNALMAELPNHVFDAAQIGLLYDLAQVCTFFKNESLVEDNLADERMIPVALADEATQLRKRLLKLVAYWLEEDPVAALEIAAIREGNGYRDLAADLFRLAKLIDQHQARLSRDPLLYQATDAAHARRLSAAISDALAEPDPLGDELGARLLTLLRATYDDVRAAAIFVSRKVLPAESFPSLHGINRGGRRKKPAGPPPSP